MTSTTEKGALSVNEFLQWASIGRTKFYDEISVVMYGGARLERLPWGRAQRPTVARKTEAGAPGAEDPRK